MSRKAYDANNDKYIRYYESILESMPEYMSKYVRQIYSDTSPKTIHGYLTNIQHFFTYLTDTDADISSFEDISPDYLDALSLDDLNIYFQSLDRDNKLGPTTRSRMMSAIKGLFRYLHENKEIQNSAYLSLKAPKIPKKETVTYMDETEIAMFMDNILNGTTLTLEERKYHERFAVRDVALLSLLMGTGIRVSECVSLDINDVDLKRGEIKLVRKRNKESNVFISDTVKEYLSEYLKERKRMNNVKDEDKDALFISRKHSRITARAVQNLVKKYAPASIVGLKNISPHKLRSTYAVNMYDKIGDIYAISENLGHESISTTQIYTRVSEKRKEQIGRIDIIG